MEQTQQAQEERPLSEDLRQYAMLLWHWAWLLVLAGGLAAGAAYYVSQRMTPVYQASTTVLVDYATSDGSNEYQSVLMSERLTQTYAELLTRQPVLEEVASTLNINHDVGDLREMITVQPVRDTQLIELQVESVNPELASLVANTVVDVFVEQNESRQSERYAASKESLSGQLDRIREKIQETNQALDTLEENGGDEDEINQLELTLSQYQNTYSNLLQSYEEVRTKEAQSMSSIVQVEPATTPGSPVRPRTLTNTALAGVVGVMVAVGGVFLIEALDNSIKSPGQVERLTKLPVLGLIPQYPAESDHLISIEHPRHPSVEAFRALRTNIKYTEVDDPVRKILVTSADPQVGKTDVASNLAVVFAQSGNSVILVDGDMRRPKIHQRFDVENRQGLSRLFVRGKENADKFYKGHENVPNLSIVTSGSIPPNPSELLGSEKMGQLLETFQEGHDYLILDAPPVMAVTDAVIMSKFVDGVLLVTKPGVSKAGAVEQSAEQLRRVKANLLGVVLNEIPRNGNRYYYQGYQYYTYEDYYSEEGE